MPRFVERLDDRCEASSSSSGSSSSGKRSRDDRRASDASLSTDEVCRRIRKKLAVSFDQAVPVAAHHAALTHVCTLRDALVAGKTLAPDARMHLVNTGVALARRVFLAIETDEAAAAMHTTIGMLFFLVSFTLDGVADSDDEMEEAPAPTGTTDAVSDASPDASPAASAALLVKHWKERSIAELHCSDDDFSPARMCRALMELGPNVPLAELVQHGLDFFQSTANLMVERAINAAVEPKMDFLTLSASSVLMQVDDDQRDARLTALCEAAESEAGQTAFRDLILSFTLPRSVVGTRRSVLMTRAANKLATKDFPLVLNDAHEVAMNGTQHAWSTSTNEIHRMACILAGICVLTTSDIRRGDAFDGRVVLPFLQCRQHPSEKYRLVYIEQENDWVVLESSSKSGQVVHARGSGLAGLEAAALVFMKNVRT